MCRMLLLSAVLTIAAPAPTVQGQTIDDEYDVVTGPNYATVIVNTRDIANRRKIEAAFTPTFPISGLFNTYFDAGVGTTIGIWQPVGTGRPTSNGGWLQPIIGGSFQYDHFFGRDDIQVNTLNRNLRIDDADVYTGAITFGLQNVRPVGANFLFVGGGLTARAGAVSVDEEPFRFDPSVRVGTPTFDYEDNGSLAGYRVEGWAGLKLRNEMAAFLKVGFGHDWTDAILGDTHSSGIVTVSFGVEVPLGLRSNETAWSAQRRSEISFGP